MPIKSTPAVELLALVIVCAWCKAVRCADGTFSKPLAVLLQGADVSHGICSACYDVLMLKPSV